MQNYGTPPPYVPPPRRSCSPFAILGVACGGCGLLIALLVLVVGFFGWQVAREVSKPGVPPPTQYVGTWQSQGGPGTQTLIIGSDGMGSYHGENQGAYERNNVQIDGGRVVIDEKTRSLSVTFVGIGKHLHIDETPHEVRGTMVMKLDGASFRRVGGAPAGGSGSRPGGDRSTGSDTI